MVNVLIVGTTRGAATDAAGRYEIINLSPATYQVRISMIGYKEKTISNVKTQWQDKRQKVLAVQSAGKSRKKLLLWTAGLALVGTWFYSNLPESDNPIIKASPIIVEAAQ